MNYKKKGDYISIIGELNIKTYDASDGTKKTSIQINVNNFDFPPIAKVQANEITRPYDQSFDNVNMNDLYSFII